MSMSKYNEEKPHDFRLGRKKDGSLCLMGAFREFHGDNMLTATEVVVWKPLRILELNDNREVISGVEQ